VVKLTPAQRKLVEGPNLAHVATLMKDGSPQVTPVWVDCDDTHILINTAEGRQKPRNLERDPRIALSIAAQDDQQMYIQIRGRVVEITREGAFEHISKLGKKYWGPDFEYPRRPGETRIIVRIEPESVTGRA
jgi:PPOX class probable F420-dependent enzyme